jgi:hypothetical protein
MLAVMFVDDPGQFPLPPGPCNYPGLEIIIHQFKLMKTITCCIDNGHLFRLHSYLDLYACKTQTNIAVNKTTYYGFYL